MTRVWRRIVRPYVIALAAVALFAFAGAGIAVALMSRPAPPTHLRITLLPEHAKPSPTPSK